MVAVGPELDATEGDADANNGGNRGGFKMVTLRSHKAKGNNKGASAHAHAHKGTPEMDAYFVLLANMSEQPRFSTRLR
jgi:hypothetical protein